MGLRMFTLKQQSLQYSTAVSVCKQMSSKPHQIRKDLVGLAKTGRRAISAPVSIFCNCSSLIFLLSRV